ncbi:MAG: glycosyltransferase N-terminal domain-containing protein [Bacteroidota bacterium]
MLILYRIAISAYGFLISLLSLWNTKAKKFKDGRKGLFGKLQMDLDSNQRKDPVIWIHAASLGEFEQGRPLIESIKSDDTPYRVLLTFFSPSGYEVRKHYELADWVYYLPLDTPKNAKKFVETVNPALAILIKYEFWYYYLKNLTERKIPVLVVSAIFRKNQFMMKRVGKFFKPVLEKIDYYFVQDEVSAELISRFTPNVLVTGDTRFDRVAKIASEAKAFEIVEAFLGEEACFMIGSSWSSDMKLLVPFIRAYQQEVKFIIAPHNIKEEEIVGIQRELADTTTYSNPEKASSARILIIDNIGMLSSLYNYAQYVYVGGGLRGALHNTIEAAVYGVPVFFGKHDNNRKFREAMDLVKIGAAFEVTETQELTEIFEKVKSDESKYEKLCQSSADYVRSKTGATEAIMKKVQEIV